MFQDIFKMERKTKIYTILYRLNLKTRLDLNTPSNGSKKHKEILKIEFH